MVYPPLSAVPPKILSAVDRAHPSLPLPPTPVPGCPEAAFTVPHSNQPLNPLDVSMPVPGAANHAPAMPVADVMLMSKFASAVLRNANVKYCIPVSPERFGPAGR